MSVGSKFHRRYLSARGGNTIPVTAVLTPATTQPPPRLNPNAMTAVPVPMPPAPAPAKEKKTYDIFGMELTPLEIGVGGTVLAILGYKLLK